MIQREITRLDLKTDDITEFDNLKKELEQQRRARQMQQQSASVDDMQGLASGTGGASNQGEVTPGNTPVGLLGDANKLMDPKTRQERIQQRIGYDPRPAVASTSNRIGELRGGE